MILNPASAGGRTGHLANRLRRRLETRLGGLEYRATKAPRDAVEFARQACRDRMDRILVIGGDGTASEVVSGVLENDTAVRPAIGLLPCGSGCDWARSLGLTRNFEAAVDIIEGGAHRRVDVGRIDYSDARGEVRRAFFANETSAGVSGEVMRRIASSRSRLVRPRFLLAAVGSILAHRPSELSVEIDGRRIFEGPISMVVAANGRYFGAGMLVAPNAQLDDGVLDVVLVHGLSRSRLLANLPSIYRGRHLRHPSVSSFAGREMQLIPREGVIAAEVDGEYRDVVSMRASVVPGALRVFAARNSGARRG